MPKAVVAYIRVSTTRQGRSGLGLEAQQAAIARFCEAEGFEVAVSFRALPPISFPGRPERWWGDEALKAETDAPQATLKQRHQAAGDVLALRRRGFFSAGALFSMASHIPVETAQ
jgi:hypothetical protein